MKITNTKYYISILLLFCFFSNIKAQDYKRTAWWYFGNKAGLHFTDSGVVADINSQMAAGEGCATISDKNGNFLLTTNGQSVWNKKKQQIIDGDNLLGGGSTTQNSIIIPIGNNDSLFYIFTLDAGGAGVGKGLNYNIVDITYHDTGKIIAKNQFLLNDLTEKMTATKHANGLDYWLIVHSVNTNYFHTFLIKNNGDISCPFINEIGLTYTDYSEAGGMKFSSNGKLLSVAMHLARYVDLYNFDNLTGKLSNNITISNVDFTYQIEFSNNNKYLYVSERKNNLSKFNISIYEKNKIELSKKIIYTTTKEIPALQLGVDSNIYYSLYGSNYISAILNSNTDSAYLDTNNINLLSKKTQYGLPNFITSYFYRTKLDFSYNQECNNSIVEFKEKYDTSFSTITWNIYKDSTLIQSYSISNPRHTFTDTGIYDIELIIDNNTMKKQVYIEPEIFQDSIFVSCNKDSFSIHIPDNFRCINWSNGSEQKDTLIKHEGIYKVSAYNTKGCYITDSLIVKFSYINKPNIRQTNDTLYSDSTEFNYTWYKNNDELLIDNYKLIISDTGMYYLILKNELGCEKYSDTIEISCKHYIPNIQRKGFTDSLFTNIFALKYQWFVDGNLIPNSNNQKIRINEKGNYKLETEDSFKCINTSNIYSVSILNISNILNENIRIYPNPTTNEIFIEGIESDTIAVIYDITGKKIIEKHIDKKEKKIGLLDFEDGIYILKINNQNFKIIKN